MVGCGAGEMVVLKTVVQVFVRRHLVLAMVTNVGGDGVIVINKTG